MGNLGAVFDVPELHEVTPEDLPALQELIETDAGYAERVTGYPPGPSDALSLAMMRPEGLPEDHKVVLGAWDRTAGAPRLAAVVDLLRAYPDDGCAYVGLLQVRWELQGSGLGTTVWQLTEDWLAERWPEVTRVRLAVVDTNARVATPFWERVGFVATGEERPYRYDKLESTSLLMEKSLGAETGRSSRGR